jgi:hypothetical protein
VQGAIANTSTATTLTVNFDNPTTPGNTYVVCIAINQGVGVSTVGDGSNSYASLGSVTSASNVTVYIYVAAESTASVSSITVTWPTHAPLAAVTVAINEFAPVVGADSNAVNYNHFSPDSSPTCGTVPVTGSNELVIVCYGQDGLSLGAPSTISGGLAILQEQTTTPPGCGLGVAYIGPVSSGVSAVWALNAATFWSAVGVSLDL